MESWYGWTTKLFTMMDDLLLRTEKHDSFLIPSVSKQIPTMFRGQQRCFNIMVFVINDNINNEVFHSIAVSSLHGGFHILPFGCCVPEKQ